MSTTAPVVPPRRRSVTALGANLLVVWSVALIAATAWWMFDPVALFFFAGAAACVIVTIPLTRQSYSIMSPWSLVAVAVYVGCGLRGLAISAQVTTGGRTLDELFLLGQGPDYFLRPILIYLLALAALTAAFMLGADGVRPADGRGLLSRYQFRPYVLLVAGVLAAIGLVAFVVFVQQSGGISVESLSVKRLRGPGEEYASNGVLRFLNNFSAVAFWVVAAVFADSNRRIGPTSSGGWILAFFALNAVIMPIYSSSRTDAVFTLLFGVGIAYMVRPRRLPKRALIILASGLLLLLAVMTLLRSVAQSGTVVESTTDSLRESAGNALVFNRNFGDMATAAHVINAVPEAIPYQDGRTILTYALAPLPRVLWPDKPVINVGPLIGLNIYGLERAGVPPGFVGDLYLNFGTSGVLIGAVLIGRLLRMFDRWRLRHAAHPPAAFALVYVPTAFVFAQGVVNKGIGAAMFNSTVMVAAIAIALLLVGTRREVRPRSLASTGPPGPPAPLPRQRRA